MARHIEFKFDDKLQYQLDAINSVTELFKGLPKKGDAIYGKSYRNKSFGENEPIRNIEIFSGKKLEENLNKVQLKNNLFATSLEGNDFTLEMETGTGKTYVYLRTILELNKEFRPEYTFLVCTCGDDIGKTDIFVEELLDKYQIALHAKYSIIMPNTYIALPGFDVDSSETTKEKLKAAKERIRNIAISIVERKRVSDIHPGKFAWIKSYLLRPIFNKLLTSPRHFKVNKNKCIGCNICAKVCPTKNISMSSIHPSSPQWNNQCANCLACYHHCPQHCISYGKYSKGKGQYLYKTSSIGISHSDTGRESSI